MSGASSKGDELKPLVPEAAKLSQGGRKTTLRMRQDQIILPDPQKTLEDPDGEAEVTHT